MLESAYKTVILLVLGHVAIDRLGAAHIVTVETVAVDFTLHTECPDFLRVISVQVLIDLPQNPVECLARDCKQLCVLGAAPDSQRPQLLSLEQRYFSEVVPGGQLAHKSFPARRHHLQALDVALLNDIKNFSPLSSPYNSVPLFEPLHLQAV